MKLLGAALVMLSSVVIGIDMILCKRQNIQEIKTAVSFLTQLKTTLSFSLKSPVELFEDAEAVDNFFVREKTAELCNLGSSFRSAYKKAVEMDESLDRNDKYTLSALGDFLGLFDKETQEKRLDILIEDMKKLLEFKEAEILKKEKLYMLISFSVGLGLVIILI